MTEWSVTPAAGRLLDFNAMRRLMRGPMLSLASQAIGVVQLALLLWRAGANTATDAYFYLFNFGMMPTQILVVGLLYPLLLNEERLTAAGVRRLRILTPFASAATTLLAIGWLLHRDRLPDDLYPLAVLMALNAAVQSQLWFRGMVAEANGDPRWMSSVALPANGLACLTLLFPWHGAAATTTAMATALVVGNSAFLLWVWTRRVGVTVKTSEIPVVRASSIGWLVLKSGSGSASAAVFQSLAVLLPASSVTLLNIAIKIVGAASTTFVNAIAPAILHQDTTSKRGSRIFMWALAASMSVAGVVGVAGTAIIRPSALLASVVVGLWLVTASVAPVSQRMAYRWLPPSASRLNIASVALVALLALLSAQAAGFSLVVLLCAYAALDGVSGTAMLVALRERTMTLLLGGFSLAAVAIWTIELVR